MKYAALLTLISALFCSPVGAVQVTNLIDNLTTSQSIFTNNASATNTIATAGAIGGYRTMTLTTAGANTTENTGLFVSGTTNRLTLSSPIDTTANFSITWGGAGGNTGLNADFGAGQALVLSNSFLSFFHRTADQANNFTWTFTDLANNTATYGGTFPVKTTALPLTPYSISLDSFTNSGAVDWNAINYITFSGGGVEDLDMTVVAPIQVVASTIPEPGTWALLATGVAGTFLAMRRRISARR